MATQIKTPKDVQSLGTILGIWAHPDDETFTMGGILAAAVQNGQRVICITATRGEKGVQDETRWPAKDLADIRTKELTAAMNILGVTELRWLDYPDGDCENVDDAVAISAIQALIRKYQPDSIVTFGKDGLTGHTDHCQVSCWAEEALKKSGTPARLFYAIQTKQQYEAIKPIDEQFNIFFNIDVPPLSDPEKCSICFELSDEIYDLKLKALQAMPSQYEALLKQFKPQLEVAIRVEAFVRAN